MSSACPPCALRESDSRKVSDPHPVSSVGDHDLGVLTIADLAPKIADAVPPTHPIPGTPEKVGPASCAADLLYAARPPAIVIDPTSHPRARLNSSPRPSACE